MTIAASTATSRPRALLWALAVTLLATAWFALQPDDSLIDADGSTRPATASSRAALRNSAPPHSTTSPTKLALAASAGQWPVTSPDTQRAAWPARDENAASPWQPPPAPGPAVPMKGVSPTAVAAAEAAVIPAPKFPFSYIGRWEEGGTQQVLLLGPSRVWAVAPGGVVDGQWRLDRIDAMSLVVTYLPQGASMTVSLQAAPAKPS